MTKLKSNVILKLFLSFFRLYHPDVLNLMSGHWSTQEPLNPEIVDKLCTVAVRQHLAGYSLCHELYK